MHTSSPDLLGLHRVGRSGCRSFDEPPRVAALRATNRRVDISRSPAPLPTRGHGVNDYGSGHPFSGQGNQGSSAPEMPPLAPNPASRPSPHHPAASAGGADRVSDPIPFRRPV